MYKMTLLDKISFILVLLGSINWGLIGLFKVNLVKILVMDSVILQRIVYIVIFAGAINLIILILKCTPFDIKS